MHDGMQIRVFKVLSLPRGFLFRKIVVENGGISVGWVCGGGDKGGMGRGSHFGQRVGRANGSGIGGSGGAAVRERERD
jgi:hypothetical protein